MKRYSVALLRERLAEALDHAERGEPVIVERKGIQYRLSVEAGRTRKTPRLKPRIEILDPAVARGEWTWDWRPEGVRFRPRRRRA